MRDGLKSSRFFIYVGAVRPAFLTASAAPVVVGTAAGFVWTGTVNWLLFVLALAAAVCLHAGANVANDYFDHKSGNDWVNPNPTPFSGGSRYIQQGLLSPRATLAIGLVLLAGGACLGLVIVYLTGSVFIFVLGVVGLLGGFFYTAPPIKLSYRTFGELTIAILFGPLPVIGAFYIQAGKIFTALVAYPAMVMGILIFLVILINEFPDVTYDGQVNKRTLVVRFGIDSCMEIYRIGLLAPYVVTVSVMLFSPLMFWPGLFFSLTLPLAISVVRLANKKELTTPGLFRVNALTILLHLAGALALTGGFVVERLLHPIAYESIIDISGIGP